MFVLFFYYTFEILKQVVLRTFKRNIVKVFSKTLGGQRPKLRINKGQFSTELYISSSGTTLMIHPIRISTINKRTVTVT